MWRIAGRYSLLGIEMWSAVAVGTLGGRWLDTHLGTSPYLFWFGLVVGIGAATRTVVHLVKTTNMKKL
ncbi:MAG: AtpZ/AtpI family protein [Myxococcota bacterium]